MGNSVSRKKAQPQQVSQAPVAHPLVIPMRVPQRRVDEHGSDIPVVERDLGREELLQALKYAAAYLNENRQNLTIVTVGGILSTVHIRNRLTTPDVDFFGSHLEQLHLELLDEASLFAERASSIPLGGAWLNNETQMYMGRDVCQRLTRLALEEDEVVFEEAGLKVIAATWDYCFISKAARLGTRDERSYDIKDAIAYLREWNGRVHPYCISVRRIHELCKTYRMEPLSDAVIQRINHRHLKLYRQRGILK